MSLAITKKDLDKHLETALSEATGSRTNKILSKAINVGMAPHARQLIKKFPFIKQLRTFHVRVFERTNDPCKWLAPDTILRLTGVVCRLLTDQVEMCGDLQIFDIRTGKFMKKADFCAEQVLRDQFQRYLIGKCANAKFSGSKTLNICTHFGVCFAESEGNTLITYRK